MSTIQEVAKIAGVSAATVSRTFTSPELIHADTQKRVLEAARQVNYLPRRTRPMEGKSGLDAGLPKTIGFQFFAAKSSDYLHTNNFYAPVLAGALAEAARLGIHVLVETTDRHRQEIPRMMQQRSVGGVLLVGSVDPSFLPVLQEHIPYLILVDNRHPAGAFESVLSDGFGGALTAANYLLRRGHRQIGFFLGEENVTTFQDRLRGYYIALMEAGITPDARWVYVPEDENCTEKFGAWLDSLPQRPTALMTANDHYALGVIRYCRQIGIRIPEDLSLIGFDDIPFAADVFPALTTMRVDKERLGRLAVRRLCEQIQHAGHAVDTDLPICSLIPVPLIERQSCRVLSLAPLPEQAVCHPTQEG